MEKGFFGIILLMLFLVFISLATIPNSISTTKNPKSSLLELEYLNANRFSLESAFDQIVLETIQKEIAFGNINSKELRKKVTVRILEFKKEIENRFEINYFENWNDHQLFESISVIVVPLKGPFYLVEVGISDRFNSNKILKVNFTGKRYQLFFKIPNYYKKVMIVARPGYT